MLYNSTKMKYLIIGFVVSVMARWSPCMAGGGTEVPEGKPTSSCRTSHEHQTQRLRAVQANEKHGQTFAFCPRHDRYCIRAASSPWWPNAPGD